jgi:hypothetical protein
MRLKKTERQTQNNLAKISQIFQVFGMYLWVSIMGFYNVQNEDACFKSHTNIT